MSSFVFLIICCSDFFEYQWLRKAKLHILLIYARRGSQMVIATLWRIWLVILAWLDRLGFAMATSLEAPRRGFVVHDTSGVACK